MGKGEVQPSAALSEFVASSPALQQPALKMQNPISPGLSVRRKARKRPGPPAMRACQHSVEPAGAR